METESTVIRNHKIDSPPVGDSEKSKIAQDINVTSFEASSEDCTLLESTTSSSVETVFLDISSKSHKYPAKPKDKTSDSYRDIMERKETLSERQEYTSNLPKDMSALPNTSDISYPTGKVQEITVNITESPDQTKKKVYFHSNQSEEISKPLEDISTPPDNFYKNSEKYFKDISESPEDTPENLDNILKESPNITESPIRISNINEDVPKTHENSCKSQKSASKISNNVSISSDNNLKSGTTFIQPLNTPELSEKIPHQLENKNSSLDRNKRCSSTKEDSDGTIIPKENKIADDKKLKQEDQQSIGNILLTGTIAAAVAVGSIFLIAHLKNGFLNK